MSIEEEIKKLEANGWTRWNERSTIWKSPSGALFLGPHGAYERMKKYPQLNVRKDAQTVSLKPETEMPLA